MYKYMYMYTVISKWDIITNEKPRKHLLYSFRNMLVVYMKQKVHVRIIYVYMYIHSYS